MFETRTEIHRAARRRRNELEKQFWREEACETVIAEIEQDGIEIPNDILDEVMKEVLGPQYNRGPWYRFTRAVKKWYYML